VIAFLGGALGLLLAYWGIAFVRAKYEFQRSHERGALGLDSNVLLFALAAPHLRASLRPRACPECFANRRQNKLKEEGRSSSPALAQSLRTTMGHLPNRR